MICGECKSQHDLDRPDIQARHTAIRLRLALAGIEFFEVTESDLASEVSWLNARDLIRGLRASPTGSAKAALSRQVAAFQPATFGELTDLVGKDYALASLAHGMSYFDTHQRLTRSTTLQPFQEHFDAAYFILR